MRAIVQEEWGGVEVLHEADVPRPQPLPTEILVQVIAAAINPVDARTRAGGGVADMIGDPPYILGWDVSGVVEQVGCGVTTIEVGDEVIGMPWFPHQAGCFAEYVVGPTRQFARKPKRLDHNHAAGLPVAGLTAWQLLTETAPVRPGQRVLIHAAAGGVGHLAVQIAKYLGAYVIGTASEPKHAWLKELGADELIDYRTVRFEEAVSNVDLVIDSLGDKADMTSTRSMKTLRPGGTIVTVPCTSPELQAAARIHNVIAKPFLVEPDGRSLVILADLVDRGHLTVCVEEVFPFKQFAEAHRRLESGRTRGKLVLRVG